MNKLKNYDFETLDDLSNIIDDLKSKYSGNSKVRIEVGSGLTDSFLVDDEYEGMVCIVLGY